jgi:parallel beta-helix repeat protein
VMINGSGTMSNTVSGNYLGTNPNGTAAIGNGNFGVSIFSGAQYNTVGGDTPAERNLISGNTSDGVWIADSGTDHNVVSGNYIGTDVNGTSALPNQSVGVRIFNKASHNLVGGSTPGERNVISGNGTDGVQIEWGGTTSNTVSGNYIGTDVNGTADLPNGLHGVEIDDSASHNTIGGNIPGERNIISGNSQTGVTISDGSAHNTVSGNYIGTDVNGTVALPNGSDGVSICASSSNLIGSGNVVVYNSRHGISVYGPSSSGNTITENSIYSNGGMGIELGDGGNLSLPAPVLTEVTTDTVKGASLPHATIEVFSDLEYEGQVYEGATVAEGAGHFTFTVGTAFSLDHVTATATDGLGNTSEFGAYLPHRIYLPVVVKSHSG